jgi:HEAT repeat protein
VLIEAASAGSDYERYSALQSLSRAPASAALTALRVAALDSTYDALRFEALNQLTAAGYPKVKAAALKIYKDQSKSIGTNFYSARLAAVFAKMLDADTFEPFVVTVAAGYQESDKLLEGISKKIDSYPGFADWLIGKGLKRKVPTERIVAVRLLTHSTQEKVGKTLLKLVASRDPGMSLLAIRALGERGDKSAVPILRRALKSRDPAKKLDALHGLHSLLKKEPAWRDELIGVMRGSDVSQRVLAMDLLAEMQASDLLPEIHKNFTHKACTVRAAAFDFCRVVRSLDSVSPLIERVDIEKGRLREDCLDALKAITSYRLPSGDRWRGWWSSSRATFKMPTLEQALPKRKSRSGAATVSSFFDIPLVSSKVVFVVDTSGSMSAEVGTISTGGTAGKDANTRMKEAKRQLARVESDLPKTAVFNVIHFESNVHPFRKTSAKASKKTKAAALKFVDRLEPSGATNIHDAMELAFRDQGIDTIYLLSDGSPSAGKITDANALASEVARWNQTRRIRIHTISIGSKSKFMERLAKESGGVHSHVN